MGFNELPKVFMTVRFPAHLIGVFVQVNASVPFSLVQLNIKFL